MRILIISFFTDWPTHLGTELELAQRHLDANDEVVFLSCDGAIGACTVNPSGKQKICDKCMCRRLRGMQALSKPLRNFSIGDYIDEKLVLSADKIASEIRTKEEAKNFRYNNQDLGWGALSSTIQVLRDPVCSSDRAKDMLYKFTNSAILSYEAVALFLQKHGPFDIAYIFNGRFACTRGAYRACKMVSGLKVILHERGSSYAKYALFENDLLHSKNVWKERIDQSWDSESNLEEKIRIGKQFYEERRAGVSVIWKSFTHAQELGTLPYGWDPNKKNIVIFNSSEDEFAGIGDEWANHIYPMQSNGVYQIITDALLQYPDYFFYLRMHPNLIGVENEDVKRLRSIKSPNFFLIEPDSSISTYTLLDAANKVISFGSTVGIEATYWGKPSIMAGHSFYEHLGSVYFAESHAHVMSLLGQDITPSPVEGALKYGYHLRTFGNNFKYWKSNNFFDGKFKGAFISERVGILQRFFLLPFGKWIHTPLRHMMLLHKPLLLIENVIWKFQRVTQTIFKK